MEAKLYFHELPDREKKFYFTTELHAADPKVKVYMAAVILIFSTFDLLVRFLIYPLLEDGKSHPIYKPAIIPIAFCMLSFIISLIRFPKRIDKYVNRIRRYLCHIVVVSAGVYHYLIIYDFLGRAIETKTTEDWTFAMIAISNCIHQSAIIIIASPSWAFTVIGLAFSYAAVIIVYFQSDEPLKEWVIVRTFCNILYTTGYVVVGFYWRWKSFLKSSEAEAWNQVYNDTLDRIPSSIAVMKASGELIYSNSEFKRASEDDTQKLFRSITNLKLREIPLLSTSETYIPKTLHEEITIPTSRNQYLTTNTCRTTYQMLKNKEITSSRFNKLEDLLEHYRSLLMNNELKKEDPVVYDAKMEVKTLYQNHIYSYEVIIRPLVEYKKIIIILNNTTQRDLVASLEDNNDYKDRVLASISHELRTPLNGNLVLLQAAVQEENVPKLVKEKLLMPALRSGRLLSHLINDILDYSTMLTDKVTLYCETRPIKESLNYCHQLLEHVFKAKQLKFTLVIDPSVPHLFCTDHQRLIQVILNLLSNALKFTFNGGVTLEAKLAEEDLSSVEIFVRDTGIGISKEALSGLFEDDPPITTRGTITSRELLSTPRREVGSKGVGLGLKVTSKLVRMLGAKDGDGLQVSSIDGEVSVFSFKIAPKETEDEEEEEKLMDEFDRNNCSLPEVPRELFEDHKHINVEKFKHSKFRHSPRKFSSKADLKRTKELGSSRKIGKALIVDDDLINILALETLLKQLRVTVDSAYNGKQGVEKVLAHPDKYQIIFMDCQMPIMDGFEATRQLVEKMKSEDIPVIPIVGCTAFSAKNKIEECLKSGMVEVIHKPVLKEKLKQILDKYL